MIEGGIMVMELIQIEEIMVMEEVEMLTVKIGEEILDKAQMGIKIIEWGNLQTLNNDSRGNRYRTNSLDKNNLN